MSEDVRAPNYELAFEDYQKGLKYKEIAEKYGFFSKYLPEETREIFSAIEQADPLDLLWHQIQIAYAAIIRAERIACVKDQQDG